MNKENLLGKKCILLLIFETCTASTSKG